MPSRASRGTRAARSEIRQPLLKPKRSRALALWLVGSGAVVLLILLICFLAGVPLGQGYFIIRYSPVASWRLARTLALAPVAAMACGAVWALAQRQDRSHHLAGLALLAAAMAGFGAWTWWGPPEAANQQAFNMSSLSTDGAFVMEGAKIRSIRTYLREFPDRTLPRTPASMGGTRVLSNPPLVTILDYAVRQLLWNPADRPGWLEEMLVRVEQLDPADAPAVAHQLRMSVVLTAVWVLGGWAAYGLGRLFLSPAGAAVFAIVVTFNPCTVHYVPGKDPGQLLTIHLMLWAWFAGWMRRSPWLAALGGAVLTIGSTSGLVHIWVALIATLATAWHSLRDAGMRRALVMNVIGATIGGLVVCAVAYAALDWNIPRTLLGVSRRWTQLQGTFNMNRAIWYAIGLPIFLLFVSPGFWAMLGLSLRHVRRRTPLGLGARLAACTLAVMFLIYAGIGMTYELPRLWVAFLPTLALGLAIDRPLLHGGRAPHAAAIRALVWIAVVQVAFTALHWTMLDARESEYRLSTARFYN